MDRRNLNLWAALSLTAGLALLWAGAIIYGAEGTAVDTRAGGLITLLEGALLAAFAAGVFLFARLHRSEEGAGGGFRDGFLKNPTALMFVISFAMMYVEVMLIRYCGSQVRIFSFYKNIPLIASFLGIGLGCWLGGGGAGDVRKFLFWLLPVAVLLANGPQIAGKFLGMHAAISSSEHILGDYAKASDAYSPIVSYLFITAFCVGAFAALMMLFTLIGKLLGAAFEELPPLKAYTVNILGSLAGVLAFVATSNLETPPWVWFLVGLSPLLLWMEGGRQLQKGAALVLLSAIAVWPSYGETVWSPYQKLVGIELKDDTGGFSSPPYLVQISDVFYQMALDLRPEALKKLGKNPFPHYDDVYRNLPKPGSVLIAGSGTGNDVAAALRAGAERVDAIDIDPAIVKMGIAHHPEAPYSDPRARVIVNDARNAFRTLPEASYDVVVFGLLDSHTQLGISSVRLDNYVFTKESFADARRLLKPGGHIVVTAATFSNWFTYRLAYLLQATVDQPIKVTRSGMWTTYSGQWGGTASTEARDGMKKVLVPTDDWPFLYLEGQWVPLIYIIVVAMLAGVSVYLLKRGGLKFDDFTAGRGHMFFLGAAFLLMEVNAVNRLALLYGTTWLVSAVTIALVLLLIVLANYTILFAGQVPYSFSYTALAVSLVVSYLYAPTGLLGEGPAAMLGYGLLVLSPVYFAGLVFARSFSYTVSGRQAIGANILGSVLGGWLEYSTMIVGIKNLVLLAFLLYFISALMLTLEKKKGLGEVAP